MRNHVRLTGVLAGLRVINIWQEIRTRNKCVILSRQINGYFYDCLILLELSNFMMYHFPYAEEISTKIVKEFHWKNTVN